MVLLKYNIIFVNICSLALEYSKDLMYNYREQKFNEVL